MQVSADDGKKHHGGLIVTLVVLVVVAGLISWLLTQIWFWVGSGMVAVIAAVILLIATREKR